MELMVIILVLCSAALHPLRDLLIKNQGFPEAAYLGVTGSWVIFAALQVVLSGQSFTLPNEIWHLVVSSVVGLFIYYLCVMLTMKAGDLSVYYPIIRSTPLAIVVISYLFLQQYYTPLTLVGIGSGQPSRLDSCQIAIDKMNKFQNLNEDLVAASDAFFPFVDGIEKLVQSGVSAVIQPSGSIRDKEIIKFANQTNTILVFSKTRHFRH